MIYSQRLEMIYSGIYFQSNKSTIGFHKMPKSDVEVTFFLLGISGGDIAPSRVIWKAALERYL